VPQVTQEGELLPFYQHELTVGGDGEEDKIFFIWPTTIVHKIDPSSPLYLLSAGEMIRERFEIVVILEGETSAVRRQSRVCIQFRDSLKMCKPQETR
jgi:potassium inwardly-rectifying channel subfamily J